MIEPLPIVLVPGLLTSARLYGEQIPALWYYGPETVADDTRDDRMTSIAGRILATAPPRFALVGLSMGGYLAFEMLRQAPDRRRLRGRRPVRRTWGNRGESRRACRTRSGSARRRHRAVEREVGPNFERWVRAGLVDAELTARNPGRSDY